MLQKDLTFLRNLAAKIGYQGSQDRIFSSASNINSFTKKVQIAFEEKKITDHMRNRYNRLAIDNMVTRYQKKGRISTRRLREFIRNHQTEQCKRCSKEYLSEQKRPILATIASDKRDVLIPLDTKTIGKYKNTRPPVGSEFQPPEGYVLNFPALVGYMFKYKRRSCQDCDAFKPNHNFDYVANVVMDPSKMKSKKALSRAKIEKMFYKPVTDQRRTQPQRLTTKQFLDQLESWDEDHPEVEKEYLKAKNTEVGQGMRLTKTGKLAFLKRYARRVHN
jgi:hypothetical protein